NTGVAVYDSYSYLGSSGWLVFGGTSVAAPIIASVYALGGHTASLTYGSSPYNSNASSLFDVISGSTGSCGGSYLCTASSGYDGPTGLGTPNGTTAFGGSNSGGSTPLTVQINQATGQADPTSQSPINFSVLFSESVADFTTGDVTLGGTAGANTATV